jgi:hypothetical protein
MEAVTTVPALGKAVINVTQSTSWKKHINYNKHMLIYGMELTSKAKTNHTSPSLVHNGCEGAEATYPGSLMHMSLDCSLLS